ncbi:type I pullulanase [Candidatus Izimaplasma sp. ZiA1]|uniref:type I pullulanase n=1 Tax=Candidatus Izimoplasma sp. ZiA1 TaxID=2024899 RepID=UPI00143B6CAE
MNRYYSYLDDFNEITIIVPKNFRNDLISNFEARGNDEVIPLEIIKAETFDTEIKYTTRLDGYILLNKTYIVYDDDDNKSELFTGKIVRTELFDDIYFYEQNDLGSSYRKDRTKFKVWTPIAKYMKLELTDKENNTVIHEMEYDNQGVWYLRLRGNYEGYKYRYISYVNGKEQIFTDPYAVSSTANAEHSYVVDRSKFNKMKHTRPKFSGVLSDAIIYESHIRDFTISPTINSFNKGKYKGYIEDKLKTRKGNKAGFDYLIDLGVTHVQLLPIFDFAGVDELNPSKHYNWGYNPEQYNVPEGWFASDPNDPYKRINELKEVIDTLHKNGLLVVMDVVYNHVFDVKTFPFDKIIPGYAYRVDNNGVLTNSSGSNSDLATERKMIRKYIIDSVMYWVKEFKVDGFRFDLMGLIDMKTMNTLRQKLDRHKSDIVVYGEGWQIPTLLPKEKMANMFNNHLLFNIGHFNDKTGDIIKGASFDIKEKGYALGSNKKLDDVKNIIMGSAIDRYLFRYPTQSINYVECHDNHTFYDKAIVALPNENQEQIKKRQRLATTMVLLSQGVPFIHSGQEFYRTKKGIENSYKSSDDINQIDWDLLDENIDDVNYIKEIIKIRKKYDLFRLPSPSKIKRHIKVSVFNTGTIRYSLFDESTDIIVIFKNNFSKEDFVLENDYTMIFDGEKATKKQVNRLEISDVSTYILKRRK